MEALFCLSQNLNHADTYIRYAYKQDTYGNKGHLVVGSDDIVVMADYKKKSI